MCSGVYAIVNKNTGKVYVGSAVNLKVRKLNHFLELSRNTHANSRLQRSYNKHGAEAFYFKVLMANVPKDDLIDMEQSYMDKYNSFSKGYNLKPVARNMLGYVHSEDAKKRIANSLKGRLFSEETRAKLSEATISYLTENKEKAIRNIDRTGKPHTEKSRKAMSVTKKTLVGLNARCLKLTKNDVIEVKQLSSDGVSVRELALKYGVAGRTIRRYLRDGNKNII